MEAKARGTRVGAAIYTRRAELKLTQEELAQHAGVSRVTIDAIENGRTGRSRRKNPSYPKIERALEWQPGSIRAILDGDEPVPLDPDGTDTQPKVQTIESREVPGSSVVPRLQPRDWIEEEFLRRLNPPASLQDYLLSMAREQEAMDKMQSQQHEPD